MNSKKQEKKALFQKLQERNLEELKNILPTVSETDFIDTLRRYFAFPGLLVQRPDPKRHKRDQFLSKLRKLLATVSFQASEEFIQQKIEIIHITEALHDEILQALKDNEVEGASPAEKIWSCIELAEKAYQDIRNDMERYKVKQRGKIHVVTGNILIENATGHLYNPDAANDDVINTLALSIGMLSYQLNLVPGGASAIRLPARVSIKEKDLAAAAITQRLALTWGKLEQESYRALAYGGKIEFIDFQVAGVRYSVASLMREFSDFEKLDHLSHERHIYKLAQNFAAITKRNQERPKSTGTGFLADTEQAAIEAIEDVFCVALDEDKSRYEGLTLKEWILGYAALHTIANSSTDTKLTKSTLIENLLAKGIELSAADRFIQLVLFGRGSRDVYDTPLFELDDGSYYFFYPAMVNVQIAMVLFSRLSSLEVQLDKKGPAFEKYFHEILNEANLESRSFKFDWNGEEYEYDGVFIFGKKVFVVECKNRQLSMQNAVLSYRKFEQLNETVTQLNRLVDALEKNPSKFKEQFDVELRDYEIVPVVFNALPVSWPGRYEGVYLTDASAFSRFFSSPSIDARMLNSGERVPMHILWSGTSPTSKDLMRQLESPPQLSDLSKHTVEVNRPFPLPPSKNGDQMRFFTVWKLEIDHFSRNSDFARIFDNVE